MYGRDPKSRRIPAPPPRDPKAGPGAARPPLPRLVHPTLRRRPAVCGGRWGENTPAAGDGDKRTENGGYGIGGTKQPPDIDVPFRHARCLWPPPPPPALPVPLPRFAGEEPD